MSRVTPSSSGTVSTFWVARRGNSQRRGTTAATAATTSPGSGALIASTLATTPSVACSASVSAHCGRTQCVSTHASCPAARSSSCSHPAARRSASVHGPRASKRARPSAMAVTSVTGSGRSWHRMHSARPIASAAVPVATDPAFAGLARQAELIAAGDLSSRELTETYLERIARLNPTLNAFRVVFAERALIEADQADGRRRGGDTRPLLGVPIAIKDDTNVAGEVTARGTNAFGDPAREDAEVVRRLRAAGAVIIGKTHVPELEITPFTESPTFGATRNPWDLNRTPGGSSGGSASAVAAGLVGGALASDGGGSIRIPAGCCGLFGLKPQRDRIPMAPLNEPWHGLSVYGTVTRHVADTALFIDVTGDGEPLAPAVERTPGRLRIGVSTAVPPPVLVSPDEEQQGAVDAMASVLRGLGHDVADVEVPYGTTMPAFTARYLRGIADEAASMPHPRAAVAAHQGLPPHGPGDRRPAGSSAPAPRRPPTRPRSPPSSSAPTC